MGALIRSFDWAGTPLGPADRWPQSLRTVVNILLTSRYAMWMGWGDDLTFLYNDAYRPTLGIKHPRALGAPARQVWAEIWPDIGPRIQTVLTTGQATYDEGLLLFLERSGFSEETYHTFSYSPLADEAGRIAGMLCVVTEETERVIGERRMALLRELASDLAASKTEDEVIGTVARRAGAYQRDLPFILAYLFDINGSGSARLACATGIETGHPAAPTVIGPEASGEVWPAGEMFGGATPILVTGLSERIGAPLPTGAWEREPTQAAIVPIKQQGQERPAGFLLAAINPHRPYDEGYAGFINLLAGQLASALANARAYEEERKRAEALAEIDRAKTLFFSNVSHEFRTPLTLMLGPIEEMLQRAGPDIIVSRGELDLTHRNAVRLLRLVNTLLDFSRIEAGRVRASYEPVDLAAFTAELASNFRSAMEQAGLKLILECQTLSAPVYIDREMWEKIVFNLLSNAFKFTFQGVVKVKLQEQADRALLSVEDTGKGIPEDELPHLFERFHRVEGARGRTQEGTGIGLALVAELVKLQGGSITVQSAVGSGSRFMVSVAMGEVHVPAGRFKKTQSPGSTALRSEAYIDEALRWLPGEQTLAPDVNGLSANGAARKPRGKLLLADDNADMRDYVQSLLIKDYEVKAVANGEEALASALEDTPDLGEEARVEGLDAGADDYLVKPFTAKELLARVRTHVEMARVRREATRRETELRAEAEAARDQAVDVLESITDGFIGLDRNWRFTYVNAEAERLNGMRREDMLGKNHWDLFPESVGTTVHSELLRAAGERVPVEFENYFAPWNRWFHVKAYPAKEDGLSVFFEDITEHKRTEKMLREHDKLREMDRKKWRDLFFQVPAACAILRGPDHVFEVSNDEYLRMGGGRPSSCLASQCARRLLKSFRRAISKFSIACTRQGILTLQQKR